MADNTISPTTRQGHGLALPGLIGPTLLEVTYA